MIKIIGPAPPKVTATLVQNIIRKSSQQVCGNSSEGFEKLNQSAFVIIAQAGFLSVEAGPEVVSAIDDEIRALAQTHQLRNEI
jgi:hypothetical protein